MLGVVILVGNHASDVRAQTDILTMVPAIVAASNACEGVGEWEIIT